MFCVPVKHAVLWGKAQGVQALGSGIAGIAGRRRRRRRRSNHY